MVANKLSFYLQLFTNNYLQTHNVGTNALEETENSKIMHFITINHRKKGLEHIFIKNINSNISRFLRLIAFCGGEIFSLNYFSVLPTQVQVYLCMWCGNRFLSLRRK